MSQINPFALMLVSLTPEYFFGRQADIELILEGVSAIEPRSFSIHGIKTIGKTSLLKYLCDPKGARVKYGANLLNYGLNSLTELEFVYVDCYGVDNSIKMFNAVYRELQKLGVHQGKEIIQNSINTFPIFESDLENKPKIKQNLGKVLEDLRAKNTRLVICLDHFSRAFYNLENEDHLFLRSLTREQSFIIATEKSLPEIRGHGLESPLFGVLMPRNIGLLLDNEARELIQNPTKQMDFTFTPPEIEFLLKTAGCQPYLLTKACEFLFNLLNRYAEVRKELPKNERMQQQVRLEMEVLPAIAELFPLFWDQLEPNQRETLSKIALAEGSVDLETEQPALNTLRRKSLIYHHLLEGKYYVFSELFRAYVLRQNQPRRKDSIEEISAGLARIDRKLFEYLVARPNQICKFDELLNEVWGDSTTTKRSMEAAIHRLRTVLQRVEGNKWGYIRNVRGIGYQYMPKQE
ncbi:MAG: winged helix-turn-helix domain-containing protein [Anaerolineae bacterium]|nr:winged helix-turn-helix domain-containing protein [Anaerolineae bacterium]